MMEINNDYYTLQKRVDGIIVVNCKALTYSGEELRNMLEAMKSITGGVKGKFIFIANVKSMMDTSALKYFLSQEATRYSSAEAYVLATDLQKKLANIFLKTGSSSLPCKAFSTLDQAVNWIKQC